MILDEKNINTKKIATINKIIEIIFFEKYNAIIVEIINKPHVIKY